MRLLGDLLVIYSATVLISSPLLYAWWSRNDWRLTRGGRHLMAYMGGLAVVMVFAFANLFWGPLPSWVRPLVWTIVAFIGTWRLVLLYQTRYRGD